MSSQGREMCDLGAPVPGGDRCDASASRGGEQALGPGRDMACLADMQIRGMDKARLEAAALLEALDALAQAACGTLDAVKEGLLERLAGCAGGQGQPSHTPGHSVHSYRPIPPQCRRQPSLSPRSLRAPGAPQPAVPGAGVHGAAGDRLAGRRRTAGAGGAATDQSPGDGSGAGGSERNPSLHAARRGVTTAPRERAGVGVIRPLLAILSDLCPASAPAPSCCPPRGTSSFRVSLCGPGMSRSAAEAGLDAGSSGAGSVVGRGLAREGAGRGGDAETKRKVRLRRGAHTPAGADRRRRRLRRRECRLLRRIRSLSCGQAVVPEPVVRRRLRGSWPLPRRLRGSWPLLRRLLVLRAGNPRRSAGSLPRIAGGRHHQRLRQQGRAHAAAGALAPRGLAQVGVGTQSGRLGLWAGEGLRGGHASNLAAVAPRRLHGERDGTPGPRLWLRGSGAP